VPFDPLQHLVEVGRIRPKVARLVSQPKRLARLLQEIRLLEQSEAIRDAEMLLHQRDE
jgi:hypothetical protein